MAVTMMPAFSQLFLMIAMGGPFGNLMGMPPGERDAALLKCAPADALVYVEWAERSGGKPGAPGIDGLAADPEIRALIKDIEKAILATVETETADGPQDEQVLGKELPPLIKALLNRPGSVSIRLDGDALANAPPNPMRLLMTGIKATLIINGGDQADDIGEHIDTLLDLIPGIKRTVNIQKQTFPGLPPGVSVTLHRYKTYFILGFGEGTIDAAVDGLSGKSQGLAANERFTKAYKHVEMKRTAGVSWLDVKGIVEQVTKGLGPQGAMVQGMAKMIGADAIDSIAGSTGVVDGQIHQRSFITTGGSTEGILALAAGRGIKPADFAHVPADADFATAMSLSVPKVFTAVGNIANSVNPGAKAQMDAVIEQLEMELGQSLEDDVFAAFGDVWTVYDSPSAGGVFVTSLVGSLEVRDFDKADKVFVRLMEILEETLPGDQGNFGRRGIFLNKKRFLKRSIYYINIVGDDDIPFAPAFCLTETHLLVTPHPQAMKAHLRFLASGAPNFVDRVKKQTAGIDGDLLSFTHFDSKTLIRYIYSIAPYLGQLAFSQLQQDVEGIDVFSLPSARAVLPYVGDSHSTVVRTKDGILMESGSSLPVSSVTPVLMSMPMWLYAVRLGQVREVQEIEIRNVQRARNRARAAAKRAKRARPAQRKPKRRPTKRKAVPGR